MPEETHSTSTITHFINEHLVKVLWGIALYFITQLSSDFKDVKVTLQQILINQATMEQRMITVETRSLQNASDIRELRAYHEKGGK